MDPGLREVGSLHHIHTRSAIKLINLNWSFLHGPRVILHRKFSLLWIFTNDEVTVNIPDAGVDGCSYVWCGPSSDVLWCSGGYYAGIMRDTHQSRMVSHRPRQGHGPPLSANLENFMNNYSVLTHFCSLSLLVAEFCTAARISTYVDILDLYFLSPAFQINKWIQ